MLYLVVINFITTNSTVQHNIKEKKVIEKYCSVAFIVKSNHLKSSSMWNTETNFIHKLSGFKNVGQFQWPIVKGKARLRP